MRNSNFNLKSDGILKEQGFLVTYKDKEGTRDEFFDKIKEVGEELHLVSNKDMLLVSRHGMWGCIKQGEGIIVPVIHRKLQIKQCLRQSVSYIEYIFIAMKKSDKYGAFDINGKKLCNFKYLAISSKYYERTNSFIVEDKTYKKGIVKDCKEITPIIYDGIYFDGEIKIWVCTFKGLSDKCHIDYYTVDGESIKNPPF